MAQALGLPLSDSMHALQQVAVAVATHAERDTEARLPTAKLTAGEGMPDYIAEWMSDECRNACIVRVEAHGTVRWLHNSAMRRLIDAVAELTKAAEQHGGRLGQFVLVQRPGQSAGGSQWAGGCSVAPSSQHSAGADAPPGRADNAPPDVGASAGERSGSSSWEDDWWYGCFTAPGDSEAVCELSAALWSQISLAGPSGIAQHACGEVRAPVRPFIGGYQAGKLRMHVRLAVKECGGVSWLAHLFEQWDRCSVQANIDRLCGGARSLSEEMRRVAAGERESADEPCVRQVSMPCGMTVVLPQDKAAMLRVLTAGSAHELSDTAATLMLCISSELSHSHGPPGSGDGSPAASNVDSGSDSGHGSSAASGGGHHSPPNGTSSASPVSPALTTLTAANSGGADGAISLAAGLAGAEGASAACGLGGPTQMELLGVPAEPQQQWAGGTPFGANLSACDVEALVEGAFNELLVDMSDDALADPGDRLPLQELLDGLS